MDAPIRGLTQFGNLLIAGGVFDFAGNTPARDLAYWDGLAWSPLGSGTTGEVTALLVYDSSLIVAGEFDSAAGVAATNIASWDGSSWTSLGSGTGDHIWALTEHDHQLVAGGEFLRAGGKVAAYLAAWKKGTGSDVNDRAVWRPREWRLSQNYPNPFNPSTSISFALAVPERVRLEIFNMLGHRVRTLADGLSAPGEHTLQWDGHDDRGLPVSAGVYIYRLRVGDQVESKKMLLLK
jgi:hypothetical protein